MCAIVAIDAVQTGRNIVSLRQQRGLTVRDLQDAFGFATPQAIYKWQHGTALPTVDNLLQLAVLLDVTMDDIVARRTVGIHNEARHETPPMVGQNDPIIGGVCYALIQFAGRGSGTCAGREARRGQEYLLIDTLKCQYRTIWSMLINDRTNKCQK